MVTLSAMLKSDVIKYFGDGPRTAAALEVTKQAVTGWGPVVPRGTAYEVQVITNGALKVDREIYRKLKKKRMAA